MFKMKDIREGSIVVVKSGFGLEPPERVVVEGVESEGKNDRDTFDYTDRNGDGRWAYLYQIESVVKY